MDRRQFLQAASAAYGLSQIPAQAVGSEMLRLSAPTEMVGSFAESWLNQGPLLQSVDFSLSFLERKSSQRDYPAVGLEHRQILTALRFFREQITVSASALEFELRIWHYFDFQQSVGQTGVGDVLFTGYYEPVFTGSLTPSARFQYPLYRLPRDLVLDRKGNCLGRQGSDGTLTPYPTRQEIEEGSLLKGLELVWLENLFEAYLVQVQGSARITLEDGRLFGVGYAGKTDRAYQSLGKALIAQGRFQPGEITLPLLRRYFQENPVELKSTLYTNQSYVFFKETTLTAQGPTGSIGVPLTALHAIATDRNLFPRGALALIHVPIPVVGSPAMQTLSRFVCNQDTGGAITGPGRVDLFVGSGPTAEDVAGRLKSVGRLYFPILKADPGPFILSDRPSRPSNL